MLIETLFMESYLFTPTGIFPKTKKCLSLGAVDLSKTGAEEKTPPPVFKYYLSTKDNVFEIFP